VSFAIVLSPSRHTYRTAAVIASVVTLVVAGVVAILWPDKRSLVFYGLYAIPAHLLISVVANEPVLLGAAKTNAPLMVALAGTAGCIVAILLDYTLIGWLLNHRLLKREIDDSTGFHRAQRYFGRAPFLLIVVSAFLPVPFYPVKILAIARDYPIGRFILALVLGKLPRFYLWALLGKKVQAPRSALVSAFVFLTLAAGWGAWRTYRRNRIRDQSGQNQA
jgi:membrane protein YqaA with SNARE-associated domain